ncbi:MAG: PilZ domain-containing protein [bacterium]
MPQDTRKHKRYTLTASALIRIPESQPFETLVANISKMGLGLYSDKHIPTETPVSIDLSFFSSEGILQSDHIEGTVASVTKMGRLYYIGVIFPEELTKERQPFLFEHFTRITSWY